MMSSTSGGMVPRAIMSNGRKLLERDPMGMQHMLPPWAPVAPNAG